MSNYCHLFFLLVLIVYYSHLKFVAEASIVKGEVNEERYASGENSNQIVAQYYHPFVAEASIYSPKNPLFYGFFHGFNTSQSLSLLGEKFFSASYDSVPAFHSFVDKSMEKYNISDPFAFYVKPMDPETGKIDPYYHTTAKFCGRQDCTEYWKKSGKFLGRNFVMHLVGIFFTKRTYGIRVQLTVEEQSIFEVDERSNSVQAVNETDKFPNKPHYETNDLSTLGHAYEGYFHSGAVSNHPLYPGISFEPQPSDFHPTESRAHVTIGCAPGVEAVQTGLDLLEIIDLEITSGVVHRDFIIGGGDLPRSILRQYGNDEDDDDDEVETVFVIYPSEKMIADATFSVYL